MSTNGNGYMKREQLVGKSVVNGNGEIIGTVNDLVMAMDGKMGLHITRKTPTADGSNEIIINAAEIQAMGDVVLLKPVSTMTAKAPAVAPMPAPQPFPSAAPQTKTCPRCGYVNGAGSRFCIKCGMTL